MREKAPSNDQSDGSALPSCPRRRMIGMVSLGRRRSRGAGAEIRARREASCVVQAIPAQTLVSLLTMGLFLGIPILPVRLLCRQPSDKPEKVTSVEQTLIDYIVQISNLTKQMRNSEMDIFLSILDVRLISEINHLNDEERTIK
jgi:hypothetical protein